jgi:hypothetical protein
MRDTEIKLFCGGVHEPLENRACEEDIRRLYPAWGGSPADAEGGRLRLRRAVAADAAGIMGLYGRPDLGRYAGRCDLGAQRRLAAGGDGSYRVFVALRAYQVFVAEVEGTLAGMLAVAVSHNGATGRTGGRVEALVADAAFDAEVVSGSLLCCAVKYCRQQGCSSMVLAVNEADRGFMQFLHSTAMLDGQAGARTAAGSAAGSPR